MQTANFYSAREVFGTVKAMAAFTKKIYYCTENLVSFIKLFSIRELYLTGSKYKPLVHCSNEKNIKFGCKSKVLL